jgi:hypothetical protein
MIEDLKKLLPREKEPKSNRDIPLNEEDWHNGFAFGFNLALAELSLPSLVEYIYADLREKISTEISPLDSKNAIDYYQKIIHLLTPNR